MIKKATKQDSSLLAELGVLLWDTHTVEELAKEFAALISKDTVAFFLQYEDAQAVGFAQCQLRFDYVEGTKHSPVGYLEGVFVKDEHRRKGYATALVERCQHWAKGKGCLEFASDCELENVASQTFHLKMGFSEANRIVCFTKKL